MRTPQDTLRLLPTLTEALRGVPEYKYSRLNASFGLRSATGDEGDCTVEIENSKLQVDVQGAQGAIVRAHDLYRDPALTSCSREQSKQAGRTFINWLKESSIRLSFVGSSFLMRAFETAHGMFSEPCRHEDDIDCRAIFDGTLKISPVPYMTERAPKGLTAIQVDNLPREIQEQTEILETLYRHKIPVDDSFAKTWPRHAQQWEKFKAFLAIVLLPKLRQDLSPLDSEKDFQDALERQLPETMQHDQHSKEPVSVKWAGKEYSTGDGFTRNEYLEIHAPEVNIAIVGHSQMMMEYCLQGENPKPNNNAVLEKLFIANLPTSGNHGVVLRELSGKCAVVMDAPSGKDAMQHLTVPDVESCTNPFRVADFLDLSGLAEEHLQGPPCVELSKAANAYPINPLFTGHTETERRKTSTMSEYVSPKHI